MIPVHRKSSETAAETTPALDARSSPEDDNAYVSLLQTLSQEVLSSAYTDIEASSSARRDMADVKREEARTAREYAEDVRQNLPAFRGALQDAHRREGSAGVASYDSGDVQEDRHASMLIQYLVRAGYADVQTEERGSEHYVYHIQVHWDRLRSLAQRTGKPLPL